MNKKGQSLVTFILILPIIILFLAFFIDVSLMYLEKTKINGIIYDNMQVVLDKEIKEEERIKKAILSNSDNLEVNVDINIDDLKIKVKDNKKNLFGNLIKLDIYHIEVSYCANYNDKKIKKC